MDKSRRVGLTNVWQRANVRRNVGSSGDTRDYGGLYCRQ